MSAYLKVRKLNSASKTPFRLEADVTREVQRRLRRAGVVVVFALGVVAIAATSPASTSVEVPTKTTTLRLDSEHPAALTRVVVTLNAEATSGGPQNRVSVRAGAFRTSGPGSFVPADVGAVRFIVASATPEFATATEIPPNVGAQPVPTRWQAEVPVPAEVELPLQCGIGPCERAFWLIAQLVAEDGGPVDVRWSVHGSLTYMGLAWPSGAAANVEIGTPQLIASPVPQLVASTEVEHVSLGPSQPAAARVVEVRVGPEGIPLDGSALATLSFDLLAQQTYPAPNVAIYPLDGPSAPSSPEANASLPPTAKPGADPFTGCQPGATCSRRFLVTIAWTGTKDEQQEIDWRLTVRRTDLVRVWSTPAELSAQVERRFDVAPDSAITIHREGEADAAGPIPPSQVVLPLTTATEATEPLARLLPVPGVLTYRAEIVDPLPPPSANVADVRSTILLPIPVPGTSRSSVSSGFVGSSVDLVASATASQSGVCHVAESCPALQITTSVTHGGQTASTLPTVRFRWSLDITAYSYTDVPISFSVGDQ